MSDVNFDLSGRTALVTGASSGLGARCSRILAKAGAKVVLGARRLDLLEKLEAEIAQEGGVAHSVALDVTDEASVIAAYDAAEQAFGMVDTVIANAGVSTSCRSTDMAMEDFDRQIAVNLRGPFLTAREGAKRLIKAGSREKQNGRVVIVASIIAQVQEVGLSAYAASKAGVVQMGRVMALEWVRQGVNVNMIAPGYVQTEINHDWFEGEEGKAHIASFNRRRLMREDDLDGALLYFSSDASRATTGSVLTVDDGQSL